MKKRAKRKPIAVISRGIQKPSRLPEPAIDEIDEPKVQPKSSVPEKPSVAKGSTDEVVADLYHEDDDSKEPDDLTKMDHRAPNRRRRLFFIVAGSLLVVAAAAVAGFFVFNKRAQSTGDSLGIQISGSDEMASGQSVTLTVELDNRDRVAVNDITFRLEYPEGFHYTSATREPENDLQNVWSLPAIQSKSELSFTVTGQLLGDVGSTKEFAAFATYQPVNFSSEFETSTRWSTTITSSTIEVTIEGPTVALPDVGATYRLTVRNSVREDLQDLEVRALLPGSFALDSTDPAPKDPKAQELVWSLPELASDTETEYQIAGKFAGDPGTTAELTVTVGVASGSQFQLQAEKVQLVLLIDPALDFTLTVDGESGTVGVDPTAAASIALTVMNGSDSVWKDTSLTLTFTPLSGGKPTDGVTLQLASLGGDRAVAADHALTWTKKELSGLGELKPGDSVSVKLTMDLPTALTVAGGTTNPGFSLTASAVPGSLPDLADVDLTNFKVTSDAVIVALGTHASLVAAGRYYGPDLVQYGAGPLPPQVGSATTYRIFLRLSNTTNDVQTVSVKTTLPSHVLWTGTSQVEAGEALVFDSATRTVTWTLNKLPAGTTAAAPVVAWFDVAATPSAAHVGNALPLTGPVTLGGTDSSTDAAVSVTAAAIDSTIPEDTAAAGKGIVVE